MFLKGKFLIFLIFPKSYFVKVFKGITLGLLFFRNSFIKSLIFISFFNLNLNINLNIFFNKIKDPKIYAPLLA